MTLFSVILLGSLNLDHIFYENFGQTQLVADFIRPTGSGKLYGLASASYQQDVLINRNSQFYQGLIRRSFRFLGDTASIGFYALEKTQSGTDYSSSERGAGLLLFTGFKATRDTRFTSLSDLVYRTYSSGDSTRGNSGIRQDLGFDLVKSSGSLEARIIAESKQMQSEQTLKLHPKGHARSLDVEFELETGRKSYITVAGNENKAFTEGSAEISLINTRILTLKPTGFYTQNFYSVNSLNSNISSGLNLEARSRFSFAETDWDMSLSRGLNSRNFINYQGDEMGQSAAFKMVGSRTFSQDHRVELVTRVEKEWYDYPQGLVPDDRDDRVIFTLGRVIVKPWANSSLEMGLLNRTQDLVFIKTTRSGETRRQAKYSCYGKLTYSGPVSLDFRNEISAIYTTYRFNPLNNLLVRYWENALFLKGPRFYSAFRFRLGDNGNYMAGIYYPGIFYREIWFQPSVAVIHSSDASLFLAASQYTRFQKEGTVWSAYTRETGMGFEIRLSLGLQSRIMLMKRTDTGFFWDIGLSYNPR